MVAFQIERECGGCWVGTDFKVSGQSADDCRARCADIAARAGWTARLGKQCATDERYCDFAWVNAN